MSAKEVLIQIIFLILFACIATWAELQIIGGAPEIVFLREDNLYADLHEEVIEKSKSEEIDSLLHKTAKLPTVNEYCADNKCDVADLFAVIYISLETTKELFDSGEAQFIDARKSEHFFDGHIPDAINLPVSSFSSGWPDNIQLLMKELKTIVYCNGISCDASQLVAKHLIRYGFKRVLIIEPGFPEWEKERLPVEKGNSNA